MKTKLIFFIVALGVLGGGSLLIARIIAVNKQEPLSIDMSINQEDAAMHEAKVSEAVAKINNQYVGSYEETLWAEGDNIAVLAPRATEGCPTVIFLNLKNGNYSVSNIRICTDLYKATLPFIVHECSYSYTCDAKDFRNLIATDLRTQKTVELIGTLPLDQTLLKNCVDATMGMACVTDIEPLGQNKIRVGIYERQHNDEWFDTSSRKVLEYSNKKIADKIIDLNQLK